MGRPFRPQGRGDEGFDCLGLVLFSVAAGGNRPSVPRLALRGHGEEQIARWFRQAGFVDRVAAEASPGDVLLAFPATLQAHLGVRTPAGFVEANALLRRVVERPWLAGDGWHSAWRFEGGDA